MQLDGDAGVRTLLREGRLRESRRIRNESMNQTNTGSGNSVKLILAWLWVGVPLLWGVWLTLNNALKLFQTPSA
ncbi:MAG: hypothetical protein NVS4B13_07040 [Candidatus Elarobacter sp.]